MATKKKNNKSSEYNATAQCDQYSAEVNEFNTQQWKTGAMQASVWRNARKQNDVNANWGFHGSGVYNAVIWIMLTSCLVSVTEQEQPTASTLYPKNGGSMFFETSVTTYQNTPSQNPEKKNYLQAM